MSAPGGPLITADEPEELGHWRANVYATGPQKGQPKTRPPVIVLPAAGIRVINKDGQPVAYVSRSFAEVVRAAIEKEVAKRAL